MTRVAAVDCGTNSLRLLVADLDVTAGRADEVERRTTIVRLGEGVDRTGHFAEQALRRTFAVLDDYAALIRDLGAERVRMVATSAARDVDNRAAFVDGVRDRLGIEPEVITGDEEARLAHDGTLRALADVAGVRPPVLVLDIGGGSTELVASMPSGRILGRSLDVGSVRLTERFLHTDPPAGEEIAAAQGCIDRALATLPPELLTAGTLVGVAGTTRTVAAVALDLPTYDRSRLHLVRLSADQVHEVRDRLLGLTVEERRRIGSMDPGRADVIGGGAMLLAAVVDAVGASEVLVCKHDILDGIAWSLA